MTDALNGAGGTTVSKRQKNAQLEDSLCDFVDEIQKVTGATYSRILTAALLHYFFLEPWGRDPIWMQLAVALERGDLALPYVASRAIEDRLSHATKHFDLIMGSKDQSPLLKFILEIPRLQGAKIAIDQILQDADNPLSAMLAAFTTPQWPGGLSVPEKKN
jgi:hypothetical protein